MITATILFSIAIIIAVWCITVSITTELEMWLFFLILSIFCMVGGMAVVDSTPTNKDVREEEAHYIEQNHIEVVNGDTINTYKTYQIVWIENSK